MKKEGIFKINLKFTDCTDVEEYELFYKQYDHGEIKFYDCDEEVRSKNLFRFLFRGGGRNWAFDISGRVDDDSKNIDDWQNLIRKQLYQYRHRKERKKEILKGDVFGKKSKSEIRDEKLNKLIKK